MDLKTRKLNLISYLAQLQDEKSIEKIENYIISTQGEEYSFKPFTRDVLMCRTETSEKDFKNGDFKTQDNLEQLSSKW